MIHEILFQIFNKPNLTKNDFIHYSNLFELQEFLHPAEKNLIQKIQEVPFKYHKIEEFIKIVDNKVYKQKVNNSEDSESENAYKGLYIKDFAYGMHKALEPYRKEVVELENNYLKNPQLPLTYILSTVDKYGVLFDDLNSMIEVIIADNLYGCLLIGRLQKYLYSGNEMTSNAATIIIKTINITFFHQLSNWIIYGEIVDAYDEFFIRDENCPDPNFLYAELDDSNASTMKRMSVRKPTVVNKFSINWKMVPIFINEDIVESILFMGRIIWILKNNPQKKTDEFNFMDSERDFWDGKEMDFSTKIESLQNQTFSDFEFAQIIEECRLKLTKFMLSLMLEEGNIKKHLHLIRDYYALGRGELFQQFITAVENHSGDSLLDKDIANLNFLFIETAKKLYGDYDTSYQQFELVITEGNMITSNLWSRLELNFDIKWPLHIVFHPKAMELYKKLFSYLLRFKKTQMNLHRLWQNQVSGKQKIDRRLWTLRHNLMFLIYNLHYYLQVVVVESNFSILEKAIMNANELEDVIREHHIFISNLLSKTFILDADESHIYKNKHRLYQDPAVHINVPSKIYRVIMALLELCDDFSLVAKSWDEDLTEPQVLELEDFQKRANTIIETLLFTLFNLRKKERGDHLFQLLDQLNFNQYFVKNKTNINLM
ncbi:gamma-tubulin complex component 4 [Coccinella septempunctata]|uniref:gamma-tubulin complex component 4 n=1 Tax=Coccinella septempunctata TaxID=41139 RepID=UPI001D084626|nr:gamma-tubulin complex component 4 [Coccinella septempunctata]